ncbi:MAG: NUDIX hydrolase [Leptolyngbya sp. PLA3]|nr:MAG: NUDIX hydrolase [Cyanobacteria bacterium CYA]MCE7968095.1 NUDIX hydrolase [Leptolyngbya sp. PL-A3]
MSREYRNKSEPSAARKRAVVDESILLRDRAYDVAQVTLQFRDGSSRTRGIIRHRGAVIVLPLLDDGRIVLIRNHRWVVGRTLVELPAGGLEVGEEPIVAAARECAEESGFRPQSVEHLGDFYTSPGFSDERMYAFVARELSPVGQHLEIDESIEVCPVSAGEALDMIDRGHIVDAKTIVALLLAERRGLLGTRRNPS